MCLYEMMTGAHSPLPCGVQTQLRVRALSRSSLRFRVASRRQNAFRQTDESRGAPLFALRLLLASYGPTYGERCGASAVSVALWRVTADVCAHVSGQVGYIVSVDGRRCVQTEHVNDHRI